MGVSDGQPVNQTYTNRAFIDKNAATSFTIAAVDFQNTADASATAGASSIGTEGGIYAAKRIWAAGILIGQGGFELGSNNDSTSAGSSQAIALTAPFTLFSNTGLKSIASLSYSGRSYATVVMLKNGTGGPLTLLNGSSLITSTGQDLNLANGSIALLVYDSVNTAWQVIGIQGPSGVTKVTIADNQSSAADVAGLVFDHTLVQSVKVSYAIYRTNGTSIERREIGTLYLGYKPIAAAWSLERVSRIDDALNNGTSLTITSAGQVQYISDSVGGTYSGFMTFEIDFQFKGE